MKEIRFEWDFQKAQTNIKKHGISFEEATTVFSDERAILFDDPDHSQDEDRSIILGFSANARMLIVCHCIRGEGNIIRIISARKATKTEENMYTEINQGW